MRKVAPGRHPDDVVDHVPISILRAARARRLERLLRRHQIDLASRDTVAGIIGDHISDKIRVFGRYERDELESLGAGVVVEALGPSARMPSVGA